MVLFHRLQYEERRVGYRNTSQRKPRIRSLRSFRAGVINTHNYQAMYYPDGSYAGINGDRLNFQPWLDWY